jgi:hypothetical protein
MERIGHPLHPGSPYFHPKTKMDSPAQLAFADVLSINPWHCLPEHRPLGSINRNRKAMYWEMAKFRQEINGVKRYEPVGNEDFT